MDTIVGVMYCKNEIDVLPITIPEALKHVDTMFISDDGSEDGSWELIKSFKAQYPSKIEYIRQDPSPFDQGQRSAMLIEIQKRYKAENTWVQVIESDVLLHTNDLRSLIAATHRNDISVDWCFMNAVRLDWTGMHQHYPNWPEDIRTIMPLFHKLETLLYTYRPLPGLYFEQTWRPAPKGFGVYYKQHPPFSGRRKSLDTRGRTPLALHYGYRGPTHLMTKWNRKAVRPESNITRHGEDYTSIETLLKTCPYFNGDFNREWYRTNTDPRVAWKNSLGT